MEKSHKDQIIDLFTEYGIKADADDIKFVHKILNGWEKKRPMHPMSRFPTLLNKLFS